MTIGGLSAGMWNPAIIPHLVAEITREADDANCRIDQSFGREEDRTKRSVLPSSTKMSS